MGSFSIWHWLIVLLILILVFGTKKIGSMGSDLGSAVKGFKDGVKGDDGTAGALPMIADNGAIDTEIKEKAKS